MFKININSFILLLSIFVSLSVRATPPRSNYVILKDGGQTGHGGIGMVSNSIIYQTHGDDKSVSKKEIKLLTLLDLKQFIDGLDSEIYYSKYLNSKILNDKLNLEDRFQCSDKILKKIKKGFLNSNLSQQVKKSYLKAYLGTIIQNFCKILTGLKKHSNTTIVALILKTLEKSKWQLNKISSSLERVDTLRNYTGLRDLFDEGNSGSYSNDGKYFTTEARQFKENDANLETNQNELDSLFKWKEVIFGIHNPDVISNTSNYVQIALRKKGIVYLNSDVLWANEDENTSPYIISPFSFSWLILHELVYFSLQPIGEDVYDGAQVQQIVSSIFKKIFLDGIYEKETPGFLVGTDQDSHLAREDYNTERLVTLQEEIYNTLTGSYSYDFTLQNNYFDLFRVDKLTRPVFVIEGQFNNSLFNTKSHGTYFVNVKDIERVSLNLYYSAPLKIYYESINIIIEELQGKFSDNYSTNLIDSSIELIEKGDYIYGFNKETFKFACLIIQSEPSPVFNLSDDEVFKMPGYNRSSTIPGEILYVDFIPHYYKLSLSEGVESYDFINHDVPNPNQICVNDIDGIRALKNLLIEL